MSLTLTQLAYQALRDIGCLRPGQSASTDVLNDILAAANQMLDAWQIDELIVPASTPAAYNLTAGKQIYTIGPTGADLAGPRPALIDEANVILNTVSPVVRSPIDILRDEGQWAAIRVQQIPSAIPLKLWYPHDFNPASGYGTLYLWPGPVANYQIELFTPVQFTQFADLTTAYRFPPAYESLIRSNLAIRIAPMMEIYSKLAKLAQPRRALIDLVQYQAGNLMERVKSYNAQAPVLGSDGSMMSGRGGAWNYGIGDYR